MPCPEIVAIFYIRPAEVPTLFSVEGEAQVERQNTVLGFLTVVPRFHLSLLDLKMADLTQGLQPTPAKHYVPRKDRQ